MRKAKELKLIVDQAVAELFDGVLEQTFDALTAELETLPCGRIEQRLPRRQVCSLVSCLAAARGSPPQQARGSEPAERMLDGREAHGLMARLSSLIDLTSGEAITCLIQDRQNDAPLGTDAQAPLQSQTLEPTGHGEPPRIRIGSVDGPWMVCSGVVMAMRRATAVTPLP